MFKFKRQTMQNTPVITPAQPTQTAAPEREVALREMYERIARGHGVAEAEEQAQRKWRGR